MASIQFPQDQVPHLQFHGAAGQVTGSMHLLRANGKIIALDCGLFQGRRKESEAANRTFPVKGAEVHAVLLSHAHIDHCGRLPKLISDGFDGTIHATPATRDLAAILLQDSAHIQMEDAKYLNKKLKRRGEPLIDPLYRPEDATQAIRLIVGHSYNRWFDVTDGVRARFFEAGHMLGSAGIEVRVRENGKEVTLTFTGDVGRPGVPILRDPAPLPDSDYIISESTYGGRKSEPVPKMKPRLAEVVKRTVGRGGKVIIPAFSVGRTQTLLYYLNQLFAEQTLPAIPVFVDSPLAINATDVFKMHPECYDRDASSFVHEVGHLLSGPNVTFVREASESKELNRRKEPCIVIAASGMCEAGRILHHLKHGASVQRNTIMIVGYQARHTLGRRIVDREPEVRVFGKMYPLEAEVVVFNGFSSHADSDELVSYLSPQASRCRSCFLVHGETEQAEALRKRLSDNGFAEVYIPQAGDIHELTPAK